MRLSVLNIALFALGLTLTHLGHVNVSTAYAQTTLLNVSYDPTREFYKEYNAAFAAFWKSKNGETITIQQSHGGSGNQARTVIDGLDADVVTLALAGDIDEIANRTKKIPTDWQKRLPNASAPYTSTIIFLVRKGSPKNITNWGDLAKSGIGVITPNPKTSGGARWNYLAGWGWAQREFKDDETKVRDYIKALFANVPVLDTGARSSTTNFAQRGLGDVLIAWENEAFLVLDEFGKENFDIVAPPLSIKAEPPVTLVDVNVDKKGTRTQAEAYLQYLYSPVGQALAVKNHFRAYEPKYADAKLLAAFPKLDLIAIEDFGGWPKAHATHFADGGTFDQLYKPSK